jgi:hypothetical protein
MYVCPASNVATGSTRDRPHRHWSSVATVLMTGETALLCETTPPAENDRRLTRLQRAAAARKTAARLHRRMPSHASHLATTWSAPPGIQQAHLAWHKMALFRAPVFTGLLQKEVHHRYYYYSTKGVSFGVPQARSASLTDCDILKMINIRYSVCGCHCEYRQPILLL